jgi:4-amino-4-deoxy-L-arabinose transferase-like glycosyltransferase
VPEFSPSARQRTARPGAGLQPTSLVVPALLLLLAALCWLCFFHGIEVLYPLDKTEALQLEIARQMAVSGDWITPAVDGLPYFDKPPLPYWVGGLLLRSFPDQVWLPRLGAAVFACIGVGATLVLSRYGSRDRSQRRTLNRAVSAAAILALMPAYQAFARIALHDSYLIASTSVALAGFFLLSQAPAASPRRQALSGLLVGLALGLGLLAKGLLSLALPVAVAGAFLLAAGPGARRSLGVRFQLPLIAALLLVAVPWHLAAWHSQGSLFLEGYVGRTHLSRLTTELDQHAGPWFFYLPVYGLLTFPWGITAITALAEGGCCNPRRWRRLAQRDPLALFCTIWILVTVGLLSLASTKLPHYILVALPPTAIAAAGFFWPPRAQTDVPGRLPRVLLVASAVLLLLLALLLVWMPPWLIPISTNAPAFRLGLQELLASPPVLVALLVLAAAGSWAAWHGPRPRLLLGAFWAAGSITVLLLLAPPLLQLYRHDHQGARLELADRALREAQAGEPIQVVGQSWYSVRIRTQGRAEILRRGKAFSEQSGAAGGRAGDAVCSGPKLLLGPARRVEEVGRTCAPMALVILQRSAGAELLLARLQPAVQAY